MSDRGWRNVAIVLAVIVVILGAAAVASITETGPGSSAGPSSPAIGLGSPSGAAGSAGPSGSVEVSPGGSAGASAAASAAPSGGPSPSPSLAPAQDATLTFTQLTLDARKDPQGNARFIAFTSDGPGTITATLTADTPQGTTHMCLRVAATNVECHDWASGTITTTTTAAHANWRVSVEGNDVETPTVELTVTFPAYKPLVKITHARFDGTSFPATNGIQASFLPRADGNVRLAANWGAHNFIYEIDLIRGTEAGGSTKFTNLGPAPSTSKSIPIMTNFTWKIVLQNSEAGFGPTDMTATIAWP